MKRECSGASPRGARPPGGSTAKWCRIDRILAFTFGALALFQPAPSDAQEITDALLRAVFPEAVRFGESSGDPPVMRAWAGGEGGEPERLLGYVFVTSDVPPESFGYDAPIQVLVGMDLDGVLTGARVLDYRESLRRTRGDFLSRPGIQGQFAGKPITDDFRVRQDVQNLTGATITVSAMALGIRNSARRVWAAYLRQPDPVLSAGGPPRIGSIDLELLAGLTWPELVQLGLAREFEVGAARGPVTLSFVYLRDEAVAEAVLGESRFRDALRRSGDVAGERHMLLLGMNGENVTFFPLESIRFEQDGRPVEVAPSDFVTVGTVSEGLAQGEFRRAGLLLIDRAIDTTRPFDIVVEEPGGNEVRDTYPVRDAPAPVAVEPAEGTAVASESDEVLPEGDESDAPPGASAEALAAGDPEAPGGRVEVGSDPPAGSPGPAVSPGPGQGAVPVAELSDDDLLAFLFEEEAVEASALARTLERTSWTRVILLLLLLGLATAAFASKGVALRGATLAGTLLFLGFTDRGFLSVSHITAGISVGPSVYLSDLSLLVLVSFTVLTTLFVGRVFCGFLCPFGALQDLLERVVPKRFQREFPEAVHRRALGAKYGILMIVLLPAVAGLPFAVFHYFEPFGTVFFLSTSILLWSIAGAFLLASAVVPRFYCRYACPLGAALALGSLVSPFRIRRVEQCGVCTVCERKCPTGAIRGERIDFKECVRCNVCERQLIEKAGVCRHDMEKIRPRLVQLRVGTEEGVR